MDFKRKPGMRQKFTGKFQLPKDIDVDYKNVQLLQKYLNDRGKIMPRRITGVTSGDQRKLTQAIKKARFLALLTSGSVKK